MRTAARGAAVGAVAGALPLWGLYALVIVWTILTDSPVRRQMATSEFLVRLLFTFAYFGIFLGLLFGGPSGALGGWVGAGGFGRSKGGRWRLAAVLGGTF